MKRINLVVLIALSLTPVLWFVGRGSEIINGVDTNFPLNPLVWFARRLYIWNDVSPAGSDFSSSVAGIFFHFVQVIFYFLTSNLQHTQLLSFIFWFAAVIISSYLFSRSLFEKNKIPRFIFVVIYSFNTYLFNTWENVKVSNLSLVVALPLILSLIISYSKKKLSFESLVFYTAIATLVCSGVGINPAYFITFLLGIGIYIFVSLFSHKSKKDFLITAKALFTVLIIILLVNAFWIIPTVRSMFFSESNIRNLTDIGFTNWLDSLSKNTSILNVIRMLGAWDWYAFDESGAALYIPYAYRYIQFLPFVLFSLTLPFLAILSFVLKVKNKSSMYVFFGVLLILGVFLGTGSHPPTGVVFNFLVKYLPFFSFFRSPWYIFTPFVFLAVAGLISLLGEYLYQRLNHKVVTALIVVFIVSNLVYSYPLILGRVFRPSRHDSFYVNFPSYVFDAQKYLSTRANGRVIGYPEDEIEQFEWGYRGIESIINLFSTKETLFSSLNQTTSNTYLLLGNIFDSFKHGNLKVAESLAAKLNTNTLFYKNDQRSLSPNIKDYLKQYSTTQIGNWQFYDFPAEVLPKIYSSDKVFFGYPFKSGTKLANPLSMEEVLLNPDDSIAARVEAIAVSSGNVILARNNQEDDYKQFLSLPGGLSKNATKRDLSTVEFSFELPENGLYAPALERYKVEEFGIIPEKQLEVQVDGVAQQWMPVRVNDSFVYFPEVEFSKGKHTIKFGVENKNFAIETEILEEEKDQIASAYEISQFDPLGIYVVSFDYKHLYGLNPAVKIEQRRGATPLKIELSDLPIYPDWTPWSFYIVPVKSESRFKVKIDTPYANDPLGTKVSHRDMQILKVFDNDLFLIQQPQAVTLDKPEISFEKISAVLYKGKVREVNGPHIIVFSENYSKDWVLKTTVGDSATILEENHFSSNYFANAWAIEDYPQGYEFEIYYQPQRIYNIAKIISGVTVLIATVIFVSQRIKRNAGKN